jgi:hypothetical protein
MGLSNRCKFDGEPGACLEDADKLGYKIVRDIHMDHGWMKLLDRPHRYRGLQQ